MTEVQTGNEDSYIETLPVEEQKQYSKLGEDEKKLYRELKAKFNEAGVVDEVGQRVALLLGNDILLGRFLRANSKINAETLERLHEALGSPVAKNSGIVKPDTAGVVPIRVNSNWK
ncbi:hypothetical protein N9J72_00295 [Candidatus Gracilibacteria bacterium]|nr:hypothetical protein [Candidatus Gracilibacteria bacterium]